MEKIHFPEVIECERIYLRKHDLAVAETMFRYVDQDRERLLQFLPWVAKINAVEDEVAYVKRTHEQWEGHELYDFGVFTKDGDVYMGNVGVHSIAWHNDCCELGYWILGSFEGKGFVSEAVTHLTGKAFEIGFNKVKITCDPANERSAFIPRRLGFTLEARLREESRNHKGEFYDLLLFTRLRSEGKVIADSSRPGARAEEIKHFSEIQTPDASSYGTKELQGVSASFGKVLGLNKLGIHHVLLKPGRRTSYPHAESHEEEFVYVIEGFPDVWVDGDLHRLTPGDGVGFPSGTGISHTFLNNTDSEVRLLVVGERTKAENKCFFPLHPQFKTDEIWWHSPPQRKLGPHDGVPDKVRGIYK
jgi:uncharacterized cupin superfamily protein/RimJ/RimL family protein N-acetyltransferase